MYLKCQSVKNLTLCPPWLSLALPSSLVLLSMPYLEQEATCPLPRPWPSGAPQPKRRNSLI